MATSTVEKVREQTESEKQDKVVMGKEPEQQIEDEQWEFIRGEVEKMKEARELAQKEQQKLKEEQGKIKKQKAKLEAEEEQRLQEQREKTQDSILGTQRGLDKLQDKITSVSKMAQQEREGQLNESIELTDPLNKRIEEILKVKGEVPGLTPYPSLESLCEFESDEIDLGQYWYYVIKAEQIKNKMDQVTKAFHERDHYYRDPKWHLLLWTLQV